jgi:hypothetical protein
VSTIAFNYPVQRQNAEARQWPDEVELKHDGLLKSANLPQRLLDVFVTGSLLSRLGYEATETKSADGVIWRRKGAQATLGAFGKTPKTSKGKRALAVRMLRNAKPVQEIMVVTGLSIGFIRGLQSAVNRDNPRTHAERARVRAAAVQRLKSGETPEAVADVTKLTVSYVRQLGIQAGVEIPLKLPNKNVFAAIKRLMETSDTCSVIAKDMKVSKSWVQFVYAQCLKAGIPVQQRLRGNPDGWAAANGKE